MQETYISTACAVDQQGRPHTFHYYLLSQQVQSGSFFCEDLGIAIHEEGGTTVRIPGITPNRTRLEQLMTMLIRNAATPLNLPEIVEDWLA